LFPAEGLEKIKENIVTVTISQNLELPLFFAGESVPDGADGSGHFVGQFPFPQCGCGIRSHLKLNSNKKTPVRLPGSAHKKNCKKMQKTLALSELGTAATQRTPRPGIAFLCRLSAPAVVLLDLVSPGKMRPQPLVGLGQILRQDARFSHYRHKIRIADPAG